MTNKFTSQDLIISYTVSGTGDLSDEYAKIQEALNAGYRIVEIISTAQNVGGNSGSNGARGGTCITVLLVLVNNITSSEYVGRKN
jgi:hypothetical protein